MKTKTPGIFRAMAVLLVLLLVVGYIPTPALAATVEAEDYGISTAAYTYDSVREDTKRRSVHDLMAGHWTILQKTKPPPLLVEVDVRITYLPVQSPAKYCRRRCA